MKAPHAIAVAAWCLCVFQAGAETPKPQILSTAVAVAEPTDFVRFVEDAKGAQLQTGITTYQNAQGVTVDLIGAIHIADAAYYDDLNAKFPAYDAVLYELVGGPINVREARSEEDKKAVGKLAWLQTLFEKMQKALALKGQLEGIDYHAKNFVHADMTLRQFSAAQEEKNEGFLALWLKAVKVQLEQPELTTNQPGLLKILEILLRSDSPTELKRIIGRTFDSVEAIMTGLETGDGTVIISERNKVALKVLQSEIKTGKKKLAIFYGAAHMPDIEKRMLASGYTKQNTVWMTAWALPPEPIAPSKPAATPPAPPRSDSSKPDATPVPSQL